MQQTDLKADGTVNFVRSDAMGDDNTDNWEPPRTDKDRQLESAYHQALWDALEWIRACTGQKCQVTSAERKFQVGEFRKELSDGILLCELLNALRPGCVPRINRLKISLASGLDNLTAFINTCQRTFGLSRLSMFEIADVVEDISDRFGPEDAAHEDARRCKKILDCLVRLYRQQQQPALPQLSLEALQLVLGESAAAIPLDANSSRRRQSLRTVSSSEPPVSSISSFSEAVQMARRQAATSKQQQQQQQRQSLNSFGDDGDDDAAWLESLSNWKEKRRKSLHNSLPRLNLVEELRRADEQAEAEAVTTETKEKNRPLTQRMQQRAKSVNGIESDADTEENTFEQVIETTATVKQSFAAPNQREREELRLENHAKEINKDRNKDHSLQSSDSSSVFTFPPQDYRKPIDDHHRAEQASEQSQSSVVRLQTSKKPPAPQPPSQPPVLKPKPPAPSPPAPAPPGPVPAPVPTAAPARPPAPVPAPAPESAPQLVDSGATLSARERLFLSNSGQQNRVRQLQQQLQQRQQQKQQQPPLVRSRSTDALDSILSDDFIDGDSQGLFGYESDGRPTSPQQRLQQRLEFKTLSVSSRFGPANAHQPAQTTGTTAVESSNAATTPRAAKHAPIRAVNNPLMFSAEQNNLMRKSQEAVAGGVGKSDALRSLSNGVERPGVKDLKQSYLQHVHNQQQQLTPVQQQLQQTLLQPSNESLMKILQNRVLLEQHQEQRHNRNLRRQQLKQRSKSAERRTTVSSGIVGTDNGDHREAAEAMNNAQSISSYQHLQQHTRFPTDPQAIYGSPAHLRSMQQQQQQQKLQQQQQRNPVHQEIPVLVKDSRMRVAAPPTATMTVGRQPRQQNRPAMSQQQQQQQQQYQIPPARGGTTAARGPLPPPPPLPPRGALDSVVGGRHNGGSRGQQQQQQQQQQLVSSRQLCSHCRQELGSGAAMAIESLQLYYHVKCFRCSVCATPLGNGSAGADVRVRREQLHCPSCFSSDEGIACTNLGSV